MMHLINRAIGQLARSLSGATILLLCQPSLAADGPALSAPQVPSDSIVTLRDAHVVATLANGDVLAKWIALPLHWDVVFKEKSGHAELSIPFTLDATSRQSHAPYSLYISRISNAYAIDLNGTAIASAGALDVQGDRWSAKQPVTISFPTQLLHESNELRVRLRADAGRRAGLSPILIGPAARIAQVDVRAHWGRVIVPQTATILSLLVAMFCGLLWLQQRDSFYAWAAIGEFIWALAVADTVIETAPISWPLWGLVVLMLRALWSFALYMVATHVFGERSRLSTRIVLCIQLAAPVCVAIAIALNSMTPIRIWLGVNYVTWIAIVVAFWIRTRQAPSSERVLFTAAITIILIAGLRDSVAARIDASLFDETAWVKFVAMLVAATIMWIASKRFRQARDEVLSLNASLADRVQQKERELRDSFERLSEAERAHAVIAERERILRDMHDGVGANLATAMRQLESGTAPTHEVAATLRESLDHLKLSIDAMNLPTGDVNALLASLRYRLQPRIAAAGLTFEWQVALLPHWQRGSDQAMRHVQFLLLEAISNALQHANASVLTLNAQASDGQIRIQLSDNGKGFTDGAGRGLQSMRERAKDIGAVLTIEPAKPGTRVCMLLPLANTVRS